MYLVENIHGEVDARTSLGQRFRSSQINKLQTSIVFFTYLNKISTEFTSEKIRIFPDKSVRKDFSDKFQIS
ncbi:hypothetical protein BpHYR1_016974 [Brachionus plicatilis]|uniref:Uncharacterized protein n=1 Tax=Brachionus plicatilis TaxID=10195 RepID=A0A3M7S8Z2_BRAPC|nr:hypothetical protein BpHYR1_016974 [Brachionus plicatilis]